MNQAVNLTVVVAVDLQLGRHRARPVKAAPEEIKTARELLNGRGRSRTLSNPKGLKNGPSLESGNSEKDDLIARKRRISAGDGQK